MQIPFAPSPTITLPSQPTRLIDREKELARLGGLLSQVEGRLLTLTGPGGVGKTRLVIAVAEQVQELFPDGVWFVDLASLADPALVLPTIARVVGVRQDPREALTAFLADRVVLLVLDNLEHLLAVALALDALLAACPGLTIVATSREPLRLRREQVVGIRPLQVPEAHPAWTVTDLSAVPAVELFVARAQAADADFVLSEGNADAVAELSRRLDGLPLAVELAAARTRLLSPAALLAGMEHSLALLRWDAPDLPERHRTLHATLDWSYALLSSAQQALFRRLSIFAGGFTLEGAEALSNDGGAGEGRHSPLSLPPRSALVLNDLAALVDHSLVQRVGGPTAEVPRYRMLETVSEFGLERLAASGEERAVRAAHAAYITHLAELLSERVWLPDPGPALSRLDAEHDNVRAALAWSEKTSEVELGLRLAWAMVIYWIVHGHYDEGQRWLERALARGETLPSDGGEPGGKAREEAQGPGGETPPSGGGGLGGEVAPAAVRARALAGLGVVLTLRGEALKAEAPLAEGLALARAAGDPWDIALALFFLGMAATYQGDYDRAEPLIEEALVLYRRLAEEHERARSWVVLTLNNLGLVAYARGDLAQAAVRLEAALALARQVGSTWVAGFTLGALGNVARDRGEDESALAYYGDSLAQGATYEDKIVVAHALEGAAELAVGRGQAERAGRLFGAATALRDAAGIPVETPFRPAWERGMAAARAALGEAAFAEALEAGRALPPGQFAAELAALAEVPLGAGPGNAQRGANGAASYGLSVREAEVLALVAQGYSNREIAAALFISPRTVNFHVTNLLAKLQLDSRAAAAAFAVRHGLA